MDVRNKYGKETYVSIYGILQNNNQDWIASETLSINLKFSIYVVLLLAIFVLLWEKMVSSMRMDIIKALGILNILPTSHLSADPEFIKEINISSLIN